MMQFTDDSIQNLLSSYDLGTKVKKLRLRKKIALIDLGRHTGLSASLLSQIETGKMVPTLPTLARIATVFDVGLEYFFEDRKQKKFFLLIHADDRLRFPEKPDIPQPAYFFESLTMDTQGLEIQAYLAEFPKRNLEEVTAHSHQGSEFLFVTEGSLAIRYQDHDYVMRTGDTVLFDATEPHSYRGLGKTGGTAVVVIMPMRV